MTPQPPPAEAKAAIRAQALERRRALDEDVQRTLSLAIEQRLVRLDLYRQARAIHTYVDARDGEVGTRELIRRAIHEGKRVFVPRVERSPRRLDHYEITSLHDLEPGTFGLLEPNRERSRLVDPAEADLVLVPGLAFDRSGWRIGFGAGDYDLFLAGLEAPRVGLAFSLQLHDALPHEEHDIPMDLVVTEAEVIDCGTSRSA